MTTLNTIRIPTQHIAETITTEVDGRLQNFIDDNLTKTPDFEDLSAVLDLLEKTETFPAVIQLSSAEYQQAKISIENIIECCPNENDEAVLRGVLNAKKPVSIWDAFVEVGIGDPKDETLRELPIDSPCGADCFKVIGYGALLLSVCDPLARPDIVKGIRRAISIKWHG